MEFLEAVHFRDKKVHVSKIITRWLCIDGRAYKACDHACFEHHTHGGMLPFRVLHATRTWALQGWLLCCCTILFIQHLSKFEVIESLKPYVSTLSSWFSAQTLERTPTSLFGKFVWASTFHKITVLVFPMMVLSHYLEGCYSWQVFSHMHKGVVLFIHLITWLLVVLLLSVYTKLSSKILFCSELMLGLPQSPLMMQSCFDASRLSMSTSAADFL